MNRTTFMNPTTFIRNDHHSTDPIRLARMVKQMAG